MTAPLSNLLDLRGETDWDLGRLLSVTIQWPVDHPMSRLGEVAEQLAPHHMIGPGSQVITPSDLNIVHGGVERRSTQFAGAGFLVGGRERNLQPGDLLVPSRAGFPVLLVGEHLVGAAVAGSFIAYRFTNPDDALWVWAVLNSGTGQHMLRAALADPWTRHRRQIRDLHLPWPAPMHRAALRDTLLRIEQTTHHHEVAAAETWWSTADLTTTSWRHALATPDPAQLNDGVLLEDLGVTVTAGKRPSADDMLTTPWSDALPVITAGTLAGRPVTRWCPPSSALTTVAPGDVILSSLGDRSNARVADREAVLDASCYRLQTPPTLDAEAVAAFFNSTAGRALRNLAISGAMIPRLSLSDLKKLPIPDGAFADRSSGTAVRPLAEELEAALWSN